MKRKPRNLRKTPKFLMPKTYREFLQKAMQEESRGNAEGDRPAAKFSAACLQNHHHMCSGWITILRGRDSERIQCLCHCHDRELVD